MPESAFLGVMLPFDTTEVSLVLLLDTTGVTGTDGGAAEDLRERVEARVGAGGGAIGLRVVVLFVRVILVVILMGEEGIPGVAGTDAWRRGRQLFLLDN
jgi:hypothetical protein